MTKQEIESEKSHEKYWTEISYLSYEAETSSDLLSFPIRIMERHINEDDGTVFVQAIGRYILLTIPSDRETIEIRVPIGDWTMDDGRKQKLVGGQRVSVNRYDNELGVHGDSVSVWIQVVGDGILSGQGENNVRWGGSDS